MDYNSEIILEATKESYLDLFNIILRGSPGNFSIIIHYIIKVYQAKSYIETVISPNNFKRLY